MPVLLHDCKFSPESDRGLPFGIWDETKKRYVCGCVSEVEPREARDLVALGLAVWKLQINANGEIVKAHGEAILLRQHPLHARLITQRYVRFAIDNRIEI